MPFKPLLVAVAGSLLIAAPAAVQAQIPGAYFPGKASPQRYSGEPQVSYYDARRTAYDQGYREGLRRGEADGRRGNRFNYHDAREFQRADKGYHRSFGDRERYRQVFRDGFASGYADGYSRRSGNVRNNPRQGPYAQGGYGGRIGGPVAIGRGGYYSPAVDNGARDGYEKGLEDARKNRSFDPVRHSWYRSGDRHYRSQYGERDQYKDLYRRGFQQGYERGYREGHYR